jgi:hypothetical protein
MKRFLSTVAAAAAMGVSFGTSAAIAGQPNPGATTNARSPSPPGIDFVAVRASRLHLGMTATEVTAIMGTPAKTTDYVDGGIPKQTLDFPAEPIASKVTLANGGVSGASLDVFRVNENDLPAFTRLAWPGLVSSAVLRVLGTPGEVRHLAYFGVALEQLIFRRSGEPDVSLFFVENRLVAKRVGQSIPADIFRVFLPSPPDTMSEEPVETTVEVGMRASEVKAFYPTAKLDVSYRFKGQLAEHAIYRTRPGGPFVSFTFVDSVLTEFADIGRLPDDDSFQGR